MLPFLPCTNVTLLKLGGAGASKRTGPATKRGKGEEKNRKEGSVVSDFVSETLLQPGTELIKYKGGGCHLYWFRALVHLGKNCSSVAEMQRSIPATFSSGRWEMTGLLAPRERAVTT